jgi:hypothetical protein
MDHRRIETALARGTLVALLFYVPVETWVSAGDDYGLLNLMYVATGNGSPWAQSKRSPAGGDDLFLCSLTLDDIEKIKAFIQGTADAIRPKK